MNHCSITDSVSLGSRFAEDLQRIWDRGQACQASQAKPIASCRPAIIRDSPLGSTAETVSQLSSQQSHIYCRGHFAGLASSALASGRRNRAAGCQGWLIATKPVGPVGFVLKSAAVYRPERYTFGPWLPVNMVPSGGQQICNARSEQCRGDRHRRHGVAGNQSDLTEPAAPKRRLHGRAIDS